MLGAGAPKNSLCRSMGRYSPALERKSLRSRNHLDSAPGHHEQKSTLISLSFLLKKSHWHLRWDTFLCPFVLQAYASLLQQVAVDRRRAYSVPLPSTCPNRTSLSAAARLHRCWRRLSHRPCAGRGPCSGAVQFGRTNRGTYCRSLHL